MFGLKTRFLRDERAIAGLLDRLLTEAGVFDNGAFLRDRIVSKLTLAAWMKNVMEQKPVIENMLDIEVRNDNAGISQLQAILKLLGLKLEQAGKTKAQSVAGGKTVYLYRLDADALDTIEGIVKRRSEIGGWEFLESQA